MHATTFPRPRATLSRRRWAAAFAIAMACFGGIDPSPALAQTNTETVTVANYPPHATDLNARQIEELRALARRMVQALGAGASVNVTVHGHADFDARGRAFELRVSSRRADSASKSLQTLVAQEAVALSLPSARLTSITYGSLGLGTLMPVHPAPANESERQDNRRVEIAWTVLPPAP